jgi:hypothetical protein
MAFVVPDSGESLALQIITNKVAGADLGLRLFMNDATLSDANVLGDFQECTFTGYARAQLVGANWGTPTLDTPTTIAYPQVIFTVTATGPEQFVWGLLYVGFLSNLLFGAEKFTAPVRMATAGDRLRITPTIGAE